MDISHLFLWESKKHQKLKFWFVELLAVNNDYLCIWMIKSNRKPLKLGNFFDFWSTILNDVVVVVSNQSYLLVREELNPLHILIQITFLIIIDSTYWNEVDHDMFVFEVLDISIDSKFLAFLRAEEEARFEFLFHE